MFSLILNTIKNVCSVVFSYFPDNIYLYTNYPFDFYLVKHHRRLTYVQVAMLQNTFDHRSKDHVLSERDSLLLCQRDTEEDITHLFYPMSFHYHRNKDLVHRHLNANDLVIYYIDDI